LFGNSQIKILYLAPFCAFRGTSDVQVSYVSVLGMYSLQNTPTPSANMHTLIVMLPYRCTLPWADDPDEANYANFVDNLPCKLSDKSLPGYYNASVTVGDVFGATEPSTPFFRIPTSYWSNRYSLSTFWEPRDGVSGVHMIKVDTSLHPLFTSSSFYSASCGTSPRRYRHSM
jgi:hypothetical protein